MDATKARTTLVTGDLYDVIVVGARAAGAATAMLLARQGLRVLMVDQGGRDDDSMCTHALTRGAVLQLSRWGLLDAIVDAGTPPVRKTTVRYGDEAIVLSTKPSHEVDALYAPRRTVLDPLLVGAAADAGVHVHHRTTVTDVLRPRDRVVGVRVVTPDRRRVEIGARLVIGADGIHSTIARLVGAPLLRVGTNVSASTYAYWRDLPAEGFEWVLRQNACVGLIPTNGDLTCVVASATPGHIGAGGVAVIRRIVADAAPDIARRLSAATSHGTATTWTGQRGYIRRAHGSGWALVGDAGYFTDPIGQHGLTDAFRDAELLADAVVDGMSYGGPVSDTLGEYEATRDRFVLPMFEVIDRMASHMWDDEEVAQLQLRLRSAMSTELEALESLQQGRQVGSVTS